MCLGAEWFEMGRLSVRVVTHGGLGHDRGAVLGLLGAFPKSPTDNKLHDVSKGTSRHPDRYEEGETAKGVHG